MSNIAGEGCVCVDAITDIVLDGGDVSLFVSRGCKDEHVKMQEESPAPEGDGVIDGGIAFGCGRQQKNNGSNDCGRVGGSL